LKGTLGTTRASWNLSPLCTRRRTKNNRRNATLETDARTKPGRKKKARPASRTGRASKTDGSEKKSGSGEDQTKKTKKRRAQAKEDAHTETGHPFVSAVRSGSEEESSESRGAD
jgi:hypothetical protein